MALAASALASFQGSGKTVCTATTAASCASWRVAPAAMFAHYLPHNGWLSITSIPHVAATARYVRT